MRRRNGFGFAGLLFAAWLAAAPRAQAQDIVVTRLDDPAPNGCTPTDCSLREAVIAANVDPAAYNDILLAAGTYQINATPLAVTGGTQFQGAGSSQTLIRGDGVTDLITFDSVHQLDLANLALDARGKRELFATNGNAVRLYRLRAPNPLGSIRVEPAVGGGDFAGSFWVGESEITAHVSSVGKADFALFGSRIARLSVYGNGFAGYGATDIHLHDSIIDGALSAGTTSGAYLSTANRVRIKSVDVLGTNGGAEIRGHPLAEAAELVVDRIRYEGNTRPMSITRMDGTLSRSAFIDNANDDLDDRGPGALEIGDTIDLRITESLFERNRGSASAGGALLMDGGGTRLAVENSTFSGNSIAVSAAALPGGARGAAIGWTSGIDGSTLILQHVTVAAPVALPVGLSGSALGGYEAPADFALRIYNSILRGSCSFAAGSIDFGVGTIESAGTTCGLSTDLNTVSVSGTALALGPLANHGGLTPTYLPAAGSVAIDAANILFCLHGDQRGYPRPLGSGCDIGATETGDVIFANRFE
ncbi:choice-of-anchor Q domain-containing protein [Dokdonella sp. MW10]|uniref:choice-of-anchor Q domain-containing protein n=1 Tax=Dokdonella sp. MW10 TaxID=2992926 RepID=UPI003F7E2809